MSFVLYFAPFSASTRIHWALEELGLAHEKVRVELGKSAPKSPELLRLNPNGQVPVLVIDGTPVFESVAVLVALAEREGVTRGLWPALEDPKRLEALSWTAWSSGGLEASILKYLGAKSAGPEAAEAALAGVQAMAKILDDRLAQHGHVVSAGFTLADLANAMVVWWATTLLRIDLSSHLHVVGWIERCTQRPAMQRVVRAEEALAQAH
jgi:glutathione S-transferase